MAYSDLSSKNKIKLVINGVEIPDMSDYTFVDTKSYFKEPVRSAKGVINNLNSYATFLTPRLKFSFKAMPIGAYRVIMKLIKEYNEFIVTAYDPVEDQYVTRKMYFSPKEYPSIYQYNLEVLRILNEEFELIGTNADIEELSLVYNSNTDSAQTTAKTFYYGNEVEVGSYDTNVDGAIDPETFTNGDFVFDSWNTKSDGSGTKYLTGSVITPTTTMTLYAQWIANTKFTLSFNYNSATSGDTQINKEVMQGSAVGDLPNPVKNGYIFGGWYTLDDGKGTLVNANTIYNYTYNSTVYAYWIGIQNTISFNAGDGSGTMSNQTARSGESVELSKFSFCPQSGYVFSEWNTEGDGSGTSYDDKQTIIMPTTGLTLYARYEKGYYLTYDTNKGINAGAIAFGVEIESAVYTERAGCSLAGWYKDPQFQTEVVFPLTISANTTIYAKWVENK